MASLYELTNEYKELLFLAEDDDIDEQAFLDTLEGITGEIEVKAEGYAKVIKMLDADVEAYKKEIERLSAKADVTKNRIANMKKALMDAMILTGHDDKVGIKSGSFTFKVVGNGGVKPLKIDGVVPEKFKKMVLVDDNEAIRKHLEELEQAGLECSWAHLGDRGRHLSIK